MTVAELIERLKWFDPDTPVWLAKDPEGNGFDNLYSIEDFDLYETEEFANGASETYLKYDEMADVAKDHDKIVMLWP